MFVFKSMNEINDETEYFIVSYVRFYAVSIKKSQYHFVVSDLSFESFDAEKSMTASEMT